MGKIAQKKSRFTYKLAGKDYTVTVSILAKARLDMIVEASERKYALSDTIQAALVAFSIDANGPSELMKVEDYARKVWGMNRSVLVEAAIHFYFRHGDWKPQEGG